LIAWLALVRLRVTAAAAGDEAMLDRCLTYAEAITRPAHHPAGG